MASYERLGEHHDPAILASVIKERWRQGENPNAADVLRRYPEIAHDRSLSLDIALEEYCLRKEQGQVIESQTYCRRFPEIECSLARQIQVCNYLEENSDVFSGINSVVWPQAGDVFFEKFLIREELGRGAWLVRIFASIWDWAVAKSY